MTLIPTNPSGAPAKILAQEPRNPRFTPVRTTVPAGWYLVLKFQGNGHQLNGPGNLAFDSLGRVWTNTNATWAPTLKGVCPGTSVFRLDPYTAGRPLSTYTGGGLNGSGFGIALDPRENAWVTNYGFTGPLCPVAPTSDSTSEFAPDGSALSPAGGYQAGPISWPQGVKSDTAGDIWIANCGDDNLVEYPGGDADHPKTVTAPGLGKTFDVAQSSAGDVYVTSNSTDQVFEFDQQGNHVATLGSSTTTTKPLGIASDAQGDVWVSASGVVDIPCTSGLTAENGPDLSAIPSGFEDGAVVQISADGTLTRYEGAGMTVPWGIAVDGAGTVWVANFFGQRLSHLCGADPTTCPTHQAGAAISPARTGYFFDGLQRNTGVQIDGSGNVWLTNNWKTVPSAKTGPYGDGLVVFLGMAKPIAMPLVGTPQATLPTR
jgi:streptogramin lyase